MDSEDYIEGAELAQLKALGLSGAALQAAHQRKRDNETIGMLTFMAAQHVWERDSTVDFVHTYLRLSTTLDKVAQRYTALTVLRQGLSYLDKCEPDFAPTARSALLLALAKLLFRDDCKSEALTICQRLMQAYRTQASSPESSTTVELKVSKEEAEDAWYLAGWTYIHCDNHSAAYAVWTEGRKACRHRKIA